MSKLRIHNTRMNRVVGVAASAALLIAGGWTITGGIAQARTWVNGTDIRPNSIGQSQIGAGGVSGHAKTPESEIQANSIGQPDIAANGVSGSDVPKGTESEIEPGTIGALEFGPTARRYIDDHAGKPGAKGDKGDPGPAGTPGKDGVVHVESFTDHLDAFDLGGSITARGTKFGKSLDLRAGTYLISVSGQFDNTSDLFSQTVQVQPQLSLWFDNNGDGTFQWQDGEGSISPNAIQPWKKDRSSTVSGTTVVTLDHDTTLRLLAFGYQSDEGTAASGQMAATATVSVVPVPQN